MKGFIDELPPAIEESALVDGCSRLGALFRITIPLVSPGIVVTLVLCFILSWNEFLFGMIFTNTREVQPVTVGAHYFVGDELVQWDSIASTAIFTAVPGLIFFSIAQKAIVRGLTAGAVKE